MLDDRDYMRQPEFREPRWTPPSVRGWPLTVWFLITYVLIYLGELAVKRFVPDGELILDRYFALSNAGLRHGCFWELVTYQFMHASWLHLFLNGFAIYSFGVQLERMLGQSRFLGLMLLSGTVGGLFQCCAAFLWPYYFGGPVVGASASAFGLVAAFAMLLPREEIVMYVLYVIPVKMRAQTLLYVLGGLALAGFSFPTLAARILGPVAHTAHLGGMLAGIFFVKKIVHGNWFQQELETRETHRAARVAEASAAEYPMHEVDAILDKISAQGIASLTTRERQLLEQARHRMKGS
jgi:membrane associated rhomboid family serine protease